MLSEGVSSMLRHSVRVCLQFQGYLDTVFRILRGRPTQCHRRQRESCDVVGGHVMCGEVWSCDVRCCVMVYLLPYDCHVRLCDCHVMCRWDI